jgi:phospholipid transport system substrate-binding protein
MRIGKRLAAIGFCVCITINGQLSAANESPSTLVSDINEALITAMRVDGPDGFQTRYQQLEPVLRDAYNFPAMTRVIVGGATWTGLSVEQKKAITDAFSRMSISTFAARFKGYSGHEFEIIGEKQGLRGGSVVVENKLMSTKRDPINLNYVLRQFKGEWRVIDVQLGGKVSELATRKAEYGSVISRDGVDALIALLNSKIIEISNTAAAS